MQKVESKADLSGIESGVILWQSALSLHVKHQISSVHKLNYKEQSVKRS